MPWWLPMAIAMSLTLRMGAIDLSIWAVAGVGGLAAAAVAGQGASPEVAAGAAGLIGVAIGLVHAGAVVKLRIPSPLATIASALLLLFVCAWLFEAQRIEMDAALLVQWRAESEMPAMVMRLQMVVVTFLLLIVPMFALGRMRRSDAHERPRIHLAVALVLSGAMSAVAGAIWLTDSGYAPVPRRLIGEDLVIPAAAVLAGAAFFSGRQRTMLVLLCLPVAAWASQQWRLHVAHVTWGPYALHVLLLIVMVVLTHVAYRAWLLGRAPCMLRLSAALQSGGIIALAASSALAPGGARTAVQMASLGCWASGAILLTVGHVRADR
jgi:ribose/xylose/arabinose/galactoside ABC-type transport system permease subunit